MPDALEDPAGAELVLRFLDLLRGGDIDGASMLLAPDVRYANVGMLTVHGRAAAARLLRLMLAPPGAGFDVHLHAISTAGATVLTERTDLLAYGRVRIRFWVCGRFDVRDGQIVLWRDYFDRLDFLRASLRGILGAVSGRPPRWPPEA